VRSSATAVFDADGTAVADDHAVDGGLGDDGQIVLVAEVAARRAPALALVDVDRGDRRTVEVGSADVIVGSDASARAEVTKR
jgi:hypothetical protein